MHLSDCFMEVLAYLTSLLSSLETRHPPYEEVKSEIHRLLSESEEHPARGVVPREEYDAARFAVCAWIDEAILASPWADKVHWLNDRLQRFFYNTTDAGEEFFQRLTTLGLLQREVREVYYLCLALGFAGRYCHAGDEYQLEQIKTTNLKLLLGNSLALPSLEGVELVPEANPEGGRDAARLEIPAASRPASAICLAAPLLLFCILYLIYHFTLSGIGENFLRTVTN